METGMRTAEDFNTFGRAYLPGHAGIVICSVMRDPARVEATMPCIADSWRPMTVCMAAR